MCLQALTLEHSTSFPPQAPGMVADIIYYVAVFAQGLIRQTRFRAMAAGGFSDTAQCEVATGAVAKGQHDKSSVFAYWQLQND